MNALTRNDSSAALGQLSANQLQLLKKTIAADCNNDEFNLFVEVSRNLRLDPFRRQVFPLVFSKGKAEKRRMSIVTGIDGMRRIAARTGDYRPASEPPTYELDPEARDPQTNPHGIISCRVSVYKQDARGDWYPVMGEAFWEEFAPIEEEWEWGQQRGERVKTGKMKLGGQWGKMPRLMIAKCAEAQALRRGWPDDLGGLYSEDELDRARSADLASEQLASLEREQRLAATGGRGILFVTDPQEPAEKWAIGEIADRIMAWLKSASLSKQVEWFVSANRIALREFWAESKGDAQEVKIKIEARLNALRQEEDNQDPAGAKGSKAA